MQIISEFCSQTGVSEEDMCTRWLNIQQRVIKFAAHDSRKMVTSLVDDYNECDGKSAGQRNVNIKHWLDLLSIYTLRLHNGICSKNAKCDVIPSDQREEDAIANYIWGKNYCNH